jgi:hypothetical protein
MSRMALWPLSPRELAEAPTVFTRFMGSVETSYRTVGELLATYRQRSKLLRPAEDRADHLRVDRFMDEMAGSRWHEDVVVRIGVFEETVLVIDGIHRGIAYLACLEDGVSPERLPALHVER